MSAQRLQAGQSMRFEQPVASLYGGLCAEDPIATQALYGEVCEILAIDEGQYHVRLERDDYTGYLRPPLRWQRVCPSISGNSTMYVSQRSTLLFDAPTIKNPGTIAIPFGARLNCLQVSDCQRFIETSCSHWVWSQHVTPIGEACCDDMAEFAESHFLRAPYLWGGSSPAGFDCSGLVQMAALSAGVALPRDSHQQEDATAARVPEMDRHRGDLVFWRGHVGILVSPDLLCHATAHCLSAVLEPLADVIDRAGPPSSIKRIIAESPS